MKKQSTLRQALRSVLPMVALAAMNLSAYAINLVPANTSRTATVGIPVCDTWTSNATGTGSGSATVTVS